MKRQRRFSKSEMTGFIVLAIVILVISFTFTYKEKLFTKAEEHITTIDSAELKELTEFANKVQKGSIADRDNRSKLKNKFPNTENELFPFDPNTADSSTLAKLGLRNWQISNLMKYRAKGGRWKNAKDFSRLYGLKPEEFKILLPYIKIKETTTIRINKEQQSKRDSIFKTYPKKFKAGTILSLNEADTTLLKGIPGIGSYYAGKICRYRERLGGFISIDQLKEIEGLPQDIEKWFTLSPNANIRKTRINQSSFKELVRHPYLNYEQVKVICNYIQKYGKINSWEELSNSEHFTAKDFERLKPYITFN